MHISDSKKGYITPFLELNVLPNEIIEVICQRAGTAVLAFASINRKYRQFFQENPSFKLHQIALNMLQEGYAITQAMEDKARVPRALSHVVQVLRLFDPQKALKILDQALELANALETVEEKAPALISIAEALAPLNIEMAFDLVYKHPVFTSSTCTFYKAHAYARIALSLTGINREKAIQYADLANSLIESISYIRLKTHILETILQIYKEIDPIRLLESEKNATDSAHLIDDDVIKTAALKNIALTMASMEPKRALEVSDGISSDHCIAVFDITVEVIKAYAAFDLEMAAVMVDSINSPFHQVKALTKIAQSRAYANPKEALVLLGRAENLTKLIKIPFDKADLLCDVATTYIFFDLKKAHELTTEAQALIKSLESPLFASKKADLFIETAKKLCSFKSLITL